MEYNEFILVWGVKSYKSLIRLFEEIVYGNSLIYVVIKVKNILLV